MAASKNNENPGLGQTILDWLNPFSSKVPGDPLGGNIAAIPSQAANKFNQVTQPAADLASGVGSTFSIIDLLGKSETWKAIGLILAGVIMLILAVYEFTSGSAVNLVTGAAAKAAIA